VIGVPEFAAPLFFASLLGEGPDLSRGKSGDDIADLERPLRRDAPQSTQPSNLARVAFRDACRDCDARGVEPIRAGASR
jgi:hypothetical protein